MRRVVPLVIVVVALALAACSKGQHAATGAESVGQVTAVSGQVTARRGAGPRNLAVGDTVYGDDVLTTAAGASLEVQFKAGKYALEGGRTKAVSEVLSALASLGSAGSAGTSDPTAAAGRHAEGSAAETPSTVTKPADSKPMEPPPPTGQPAPDQAPGGGHVEKPGDTDVEGAVDPHVVQQAFRQRTPALKRCYETGLKADPKLAGKISFEVHFGKDGKVIKATIASSNLGVDAVEQCMLTAIQEVHLPALPAEASFTMPFSFGASP